MEAQKKINVLGVPVSRLGVGEVHELLFSKPADAGLIVTFVNPHACYLSRKHPDYLDLLAAHDVVACDGIGMVKAARASGCTDLQRESFDFTSLAGSVMEAAVEIGLSIGLVGGKPGVTEQVARILKERYPGLNIAACFSGYGQDPAEARQFFIRNEVDLVVCGMGAPRQEGCLVSLVDEGWVGTGFTCGGFFDQIITGKSYYPDWVDRFNIRFLYRLFKEPKRLWRRYLVEYRVFMGRYGKLQWSRLMSLLKNGSAPGKDI